IFSAWPGYLEGWQTDLLHRGQELRIDPEFVHFVNKYHNVMTVNLTKCFVDHRSIALAAKRVSEFSLHRREGGFDVRPLVVVPHKFISPELEVVKHPLPSSPAQTLVMIEQEMKGAAPMAEIASTFDLLAYPLSAETSRIPYFQTET